MFFLNQQSLQIQGILVSLLGNLVIFLTKKIKTWWDITSFDQYLSAKIIPRRLRWDLPPNDGLTDVESNKEWFEFFTNKSFDLIRLLTLRKKRKKLWLEEQIKAITDLIEPSKETSEFIRLSGELKTKLIRWDKESQDKKRKKFLRDYNDFSTNLVFKWQSLMATQADPPQSTSMDTMELPSSDSHQANQGPSTSWAGVVEAQGTPVRVTTPKTRGQGPSKSRGKGKGRNRGGYPQPDMHPSQQQSSTHHDNPPWRPTSNRGGGHQRGKGGYPVGPPPLSTYNYYAPLQGHWEQPTSSSNHFLGQERIPWRGPPPYTPAWGGWREPQPPPGDSWRDPQTPLAPPGSGQFSQKRKNREETGVADESKRPRPY